MIDMLNFQVCLWLCRFSTNPFHNLRDNRTKKTCICYIEFNSIFVLLSIYSHIRLFGLFYDILLKKHPYQVGVRVRSDISTTPLRPDGAPRFFSVDSCYALDWSVGFRLVNDAYGVFENLTSEIWRNFDVEF